MGTWNVHGGRSSWGEVFHDGYVERVLDDQRLDLVVLQETEVSSSGDETIFAGSADIRTWPICPSDVTPDGQCGLSVIASSGRSSLGDWRLVRLTNPEFSRGSGEDVWKSFDKAFIAGQVSVGPNTIVVVNLHFHAFRVFGCDPSDFPSLWSELASRIGEVARDRPAVIMGDFNSQDRSLFLRHYPATLTSLIDGRYTTSSGLSLDDILVSSHFTPLESNVIETESDHHLCTASLSLPASA